jgi:hypothetical protein
LDGKLEDKRFCTGLHISTYFIKFTELNVNVDVEKSWGGGAGGHLQRHVVTLFNISLSSPNILELTGNVWALGDV